MRVLHVTGGLNRGGTETWLRNVCRRLDPRRFETHFLVHTEQPQDYAAELRALGARILPCPGTERPWRYAARLARILREQGPYAVVHSHVHYYSGLVLAVAQRAGVPVRIAHSHQAPCDTDRRLLRRLYARAMVHRVQRHATHGLAASELAAAPLFGPRWREDPRWRVLFCGIDLEPFSAPPSRAAVRRELGLPEEAFVVGQVGRLERVKNHRFLLSLAHGLAARRAPLRLLLVGDGPLRAELERAVQQAGLGAQVLFTGSRPDVARLLQAMDVLVMPSLYEGLGLAAIEAQAAGLGVIASDAVPAEAELCPGQLTRLPLDAAPERWVEALCASPAPSPRSRRQGLAAAADGRFDVATSAAALASLYLGALAASAPPPLRRPPLSLPAARCP